MGLARYARTAVVSWGRYQKVDIVTDAMHFGRFIVDVIITYFITKCVTPTFIITA